MTIIVGLVCFTLYYVGKEHISLLSPEVPLGTTVFAEEEEFEPPVTRSTTVFSEGIPSGQDRRVRPLRHSSVYYAKSYHDPAYMVSQLGLQR